MKPFPFDTTSNMPVQITGSSRPATKGEKHGICYRGVCDNMNATWFNKSTKRYYCQSCAILIMRWPENEGILVNEA